MDRFLITGSAGHLGEALVRTLRKRGEDVVGFDLQPSPFTDLTGSITDREALRAAMAGVTKVVHTATLHKPHVGSHSRQAFIDTNVTGTLNVLTEAREANVKGVVFTSSTSAFGRALTPAKGAPAAWITEDIQPQVRNIYGATKIAAEDLCELAYRNDHLPVIILRTSRFFPEADDRDDVRETYPDANLKVNEFLYRRVDIEDAVAAHLLAAEAAPDIGFGRYIISATTPFTHDDLAELATDAPAVVARRFPDQPEAYDQLGWQMFPTIERVYVNERARADLGWTPGYDFREMLDRTLAGEQPRSPLAQTIGAKGYHPFPTGPYTT